jgi:WW domain-binding protein 2
MPWLGANHWQALLQPVAGGNLPTHHPRIDVKLTFKESGGPAFHETFIRIKERLVQAVDAARESGAAAAVHLDAVHLDQLPSYEASGHDAVAPLGQRDFLSSSAGASAGGRHRPPEPHAPPARAAGHEPPSEPPPGYEETQQQSVCDELDRRFPS